MRTIFVNGKFTAQPLTGVQRVAGCLVRAIDEMLAQDAPGVESRWVLLCPPLATPPPLRCIEVRMGGPAWGGLALWEQVFLPWACRGSPLLCLSGSAPAAKRGQVSLLHDAAVFDAPQPYTRTFVAWYRFLFRRLARTAALLVTVSEHSRQRLSHYLNVGASRIAVVPNGADHLLTSQADSTVLERLGLTAGVRYFLMVGNASSNKNLHAVRQAFETLNLDSHARLVSVGDANSSVFASSHAPSSIRTDRLVATGRVTDRELKALYAGADALVFPSRTEGFGLPPLEAMGCGCPVIAARRGALPEVCGDAALYVDPDRVDDIAAAMHRVATDIALRDRLRQRGLQRASAFTWRGAAERLLSHMATAGLIGNAAPR